MNKNIYILAALVLTACTGKTIVPDDRAEMGLKGKVRSVTSVGYEAVEMDGQIVKDGLWYQRTVTFDRNGRIMEVEQEGKEKYIYSANTRTVNRYDFDGEFESKEETVYTAQGDILSWTQYDGSDSILSQEKYTYDSQGQCIQKEIYSPMSFDLICRDYTYDEAGKRLSFNAYNLDGTLCYGWQCAYDSLGRVRCEQWLTPDGRTSGCFTYEYNDHGFVAVEGTDNKYTNTYTYLYDEQGNWTVKQTTYSGGYDRPSYAIEEQTIVYY